MSDIELISATNNIQLILWITCFFAFCLLGVLATLLFKVISKQSLSKYRSKSASLADLLNYNAEVDDGIILLKNGG